MEVGWIKLHRSLLDHWLATDPRKLGWWTIMLLSVNREDKMVKIGSELVECKRGQSLMSLLSWADKFGIKGDNEAKKSTVRRFFRDLMTDTMIDTMATRKTTRLTICNYDTYQGVRNGDDTQSDTMTDTMTDTNTRSKEDKKNIKESSANKFAPPPSNSDSPEAKKTGKEKSSAKKEKQTIEQRAKAFGKSLIPYVEEYGNEMIREFYDFWTEPNKQNSKLNFELQRTWSTGRRLRNWKKLQTRFDNERSDTNRQSNARPTDNERREGYATALHNIVNGGDSADIPIL